MTHELENAPQTAAQLAGETLLETGKALAVGA